MTRSTNLLIPLLLVLAFGLQATHAQTNELPPTERATLLEWLQAGNYKAWAKESAAHESQGPHPATVVAHLNSALDQSLASGADAHPKGAAAVKELFDASGKPAGWAVSVKTADDSDGGTGWFWYEILGSTGEGRVVASDNGVPLCFGCHVMGRDFVLIPHPLK